METRKFIFKKKGGGKKIRVETRRKKTEMRKKERKKKERKKRRQTKGKIPLNSRRGARRLGWRVLACQPGGGQDVVHKREEVECAGGVDGK